MDNKLTNDACKELIRGKAEEVNRFPKKSDFKSEEVAAIKSFFGPWPRALEAAGVKKINKERVEKKRERRKRLRENQRKYK